MEIGDREITVKKPSAGFSVTYRRDGYSPMLVAVEPMPEHASAEEMTFLVRAWKAAYAKAKALGWLDWSRMADPAGRQVTGAPALSE